jgi:xylulokinase
MVAREPLILAFDLGGSGLRAALIDPAGDFAARHAIALEAPGGAGAQCDPELWWRALRAGAEALAATAPREFAATGAVAISGMTRCNVFVDARGASLRDAILWTDTRAGSEAAALAAAAGDHPEAAQINAFHPLARLVWLARAEPSCIERLAHVLDPKDFLNLRLTGLAASDGVSMARLARAALPGRDGRSLFDRAGISTRILPTLRAPVSVLGPVLPGLGGALDRIAGAAVIVMANDTWASVLGLGAMRAGHGYNLSGTTDVLGVLAHTAAEAPGLLRVDWSNGLIQSGGPSLSGGDTLAWIAATLGRPDEARDPAAALARLLAGPFSAEPLLFLPYLRGERAPHWDPDLRGAWVGLSRAHGPADLARAALEGVAFVNRLVLERAERATGQQVAELRFGGGGAANAAWCRIKADILGRMIVTTHCADHGLLGAALAALVATGAQPDLTAAQDRLVRPAQVHVPDPSRRARYDALHETFRAAETALAPISHRLARSSTI